MLTLFGRISNCFVFLVTASACLLLSGCAPFVYPGYYDDAYYPDMYYMYGNVRYCNYGGRYFYYSGHHWYYAPHLPYGGHYIPGRNSHKSGQHGYQRSNAYNASNGSPYSATGVRQQQARQNFVNGQAQSPQYAPNISQNSQPNYYQSHSLRGQASAQPVLQNAPQAQQYIESGQQQRLVNGQNQLRNQNHPLNSQTQRDNHSHADLRPQSSNPTPVPNPPQAQQNIQRGQQQGFVSGQNQLNNQNHPQSPQSPQDNHRHADHRPQSSNPSPTQNPPQAQHNVQHGQQQATVPANAAGDSHNKPAKKKDDQQNKKADQ